MLDTSNRFCQAEDEAGLESPIHFLLEWQSHLLASQAATDLRKDIFIECGVYLFRNMEFPNEYLKINLRNKKKH